MQPFYNHPQRIAGSYYCCENLATYKLAMTSRAVEQVLSKTTELVFRINGCECLEKTEDKILTQRNRNSRRTKDTFLRWIIFVCAEQIAFPTG